MEMSRQQDCKEDIEACGREILQSSKEAEIDNKLIAIGSLIVIIAGAFTCFASVAVGLSIIVLGLIIFLFKRLNERMTLFKARRQKASAGSPTGA